MPTTNDRVKELKVADHPFFKGMSKERLAEIVEDAQEINFEPGDVILREGAPASRFFVIQDGEIALEAHNPGNEPLFIETIGPREVLGWSWLLAPYVWHFTAKAVKPTRALAINGAHLLGMCEQDPAFGYELLKHITRIVLTRLQSTRKRLIESRH
jgi:CRP-like cAMP-binding protein